MKLEKFTFNLSNCIAKTAGTLALLLISVFSYQANAQCTLGCNNRVQISLDGDCDVLVTPSMILEGEDTMNCDYVVEVLGPNDVPIPGSPRVTKANINQTLKVRVWLDDGSGNLTNSCWGTIYVEDKQPPVIDCFTIPDTVSCYYAGIFLPPLAFDNCDGPVDVDVISDQITDLDCSFDISAERRILYQATDAQGNVSQICERFIRYRRIPLDSLVFPPNYDDIDQPHFEACELDPLGPGYLGQWDLDDDGYPDPWVDVNGNGILDSFLVNGVWVQETEGGVPTTTDGFPIFPNTSYCEINATFHDKKIDICENSFKVLRTWTALDWCTSEIRDTFQILKVLDTRPPGVTAIPETTIEAEPYDCEADWIVPHPIIIQGTECASTTYTVDYLLADNNGNAPVNGLYITTNVKRVPADPNLPFQYYVIEDLPLGRTWVRWTVTDDCGNTTVIRSEVNVVDKIPPIPVCDEFTVVTLTTSGYAKIFAETFDDGSHDNCTEVGFDVRRMTNDVCDDDNDGNTTEADDYGPYVKFCCEDAHGDEIMVQLRVWDDADGDGVFGSSGDNWNTCMVSVTVQDKIDPVIVCPPDITIDCGEDLSDLSIFGTVREDKADREEIPQLPFFIEWEGTLIDGYAADNCSVTVTEDPDYDLDQCNVGEIYRTFTATDGNGRTSTCTQIITVINQNPYNGPINPDNDGIQDFNEWPEDYYTDQGCIDLDTDPENLPPPYGYPNLDDDECSQLAITYEDQVFSFVDGVCFKILRKWTVIDWCQFDVGQAGTAPSNYDGYWHWVQILKINNTIDPIIANRDNITRCIYGPGCEGYVELTNSATDECTPEDELRWRYEIDLFNDGSINATGNTNDASDTYEVGTHKIEWVVEDHCGNEDRVTYLFDVLDCKNPTPYCISDITTVVMPSSGTVEIWAKDFDRGSTDNCTIQDNLLFTFAQAVPVLSLVGEEHYFKGNGVLATLGEYNAGLAQKWIPAHFNDDDVWCPGTAGMQFDCDDEGPVDLDITVHDESFNNDFCTVTIHIQVNEGCEDEGIGSLVSGQVTTSASHSVENVMVSLEDMSTSNMAYFQTQKDGMFSFDEMALNRDYKIAAERNDEYTNGVSTLDIVLIQRHILGIQALDDPYKVIAADINDSKSVTASDIIQLRKLILGIYNELPDNNSWRFVDATQDFYEIDQPWDFNESILLKDVVAPNNNNNFIGVKIGDVNGTATANARELNTGTRSNITTVMSTEDLRFNGGTTIEVPFSAKDFNDVLGYQFTLDLNSDVLEFVAVESGILNVNENNLGLTQSQEGLITMSWNDVDVPQVSEGDVLFTLTLRARTNGTLSNNLSMNSVVTTAEAYNSNLEVTDLNLEFTEQLGKEVVLMQNRPNPFTETTTITFVLPEDGPATLTVYDISGRLLKKVNGNFNAGNNNIELRAEELESTGVLYYQLESGAYKATKKMILINNK